MASIMSYRHRIGISGIGGVFAEENVVQSLISSAADVPSDLDLKAKV